VSQRLHEQAYRAKQRRGLAGWESDFETAHLDGLMVSIHAPAPCPMIDLGCGGGESSVYFARRGFEVTAIDFSTTAIDMARLRAEQAGLQGRFLEGDMRDLSRFGDGAFGLALDHRAFHCVVDRDDRAKTLAQIYRVLRPGGLFWSSTICGMPTKPDHCSPVDPVTRLNPLGTRYFGDRDEILGGIRDAGFTVLGYQVLHEPYVVDNLITVAQRSPSDPG
jgi:SAM-dependent methyltransferase